jgi:DnaJ-class molecular chaperone
MTSPSLLHVVRPWPFMSTDERCAPAATPQPVEDEREERDESDRTCPECHGDGGDKWNDYTLPCPLCNGERFVP